VTPVYPFKTLFCGGIQIFCFYIIANPDALDKQCTFRTVSDVHQKHYITHNSAGIALTEINFEPLSMRPSKML
jgi:hypothetical protein